MLLPALIISLLLVSGHDAYPAEECLNCGPVADRLTLATEDSGYQGGEPALAPAPDMASAPQPASSPDLNSAPESASESDSYSAPESTSAPESYSAPESNSAHESSDKAEEAKPMEKPVEEPYKEIDLLKTEDEDFGDRIMEELNRARSDFGLALKRIGDEISRTHQEQSKYKSPEAE